MMSDTFIFNASSLFFAAWIAVIAGVSVAAFGHDFLPSRARHNRIQKTRPPEAGSRSHTRSR